MRTKLIALLLLAGVFVPASGADTKTPRIGLIKPEIGSAGWGNKLLSDYDILDSSVAVQGQYNQFTASNTFGGPVTFSSSAIYSSGPVLIGTTNVTGSPLVVNGIIESRVGGIKFPDGTVQISSATGGGGADMGIGNAITGAVGNRVLISDALGKLAEELPLSVAKGGTGGVNASAGRVALGAAASGVNNDITALDAISTMTLNSLQLNGGFDPVLKSTMASLTVLLTPDQNEALKLYATSASINGSFITAMGNTFNSANQLLQLNGSGKVPSGNIDSGVFTQQGNTFNGPSQLVQLNGSGALPAIDGSALTGVPGAPTDGWIASASAWTPLDSGRILVNANVASMIIPGDRIKLTQDGTTKYWPVASVGYTASFSTVTVFINNENTLTTTTITSPYFSHLDSLPGYQYVFTYTPTYGGLSILPTPVAQKFWVTGRKCWINFYTSTPGTSSSTVFTISLPVTSQTVSPNGYSNAIGPWAGDGKCLNSGTAVAGGCMWSVTSSTNTLNFYRDGTGAGWTATGLKAFWSSVINFDF